METRWSQLVLVFVWRFLLVSALGNKRESSGVALLYTVNPKTNDKSVICLASGNSTKSGLVWNAPIGKPIDDSVVKIKHKRRSPLDCDFSQMCDTTKWYMDGWNVRNSFDKLEMIDPLTDYRWEGLEEYRTGHLNHILRQVPHPHESWEISFSVRSVHDAHILLSTDSNTELSPTLWIILGGWHSDSSQKSVIRWCSEGVPPQYTYPQGECKIERSVHVGKFLSEYKWLHLKLLWDIRGTLSLWRSGEDEPVLSFSASYIEPPIYILMESRYGASALWRLHDYDFLAGYNGVLESPPFPYRGFPIEVLMLYFIEPDAVISNVKVLLLDATNRDNVAMMPTEDFVADGKWREARLISSAIFPLGTEVILRISTNETSMLIGSIFQVNYSGGYLRMIEVSSPADWTPACQVLDTDVLLTRTASWASSGCAADHFMNDCSLKCSDILGMEHAMCAGVNFCRIHNGNSVCSCSPGYHGVSCLTECPPNKYGDQCMNTCKRCKGVCDRVTGACPEGCEDGYIEPDCEKTYPIMAQYPKVNATTNEIIVTIDSFDYNGEGVPASYSILIEDVDKSKVVQTVTDLVSPLALTKSWIFRNLRPATWYRVSVVLYDVSHHTYDGPLVPFTEVRLKCNAPRNLNTTAYKTYVEIEWLQDVDTCPNHILEFRLNGIAVAKLGKDSMLHLALFDLRPFTEYQLLVRPTIDDLLGLETTTNFTTAQDAPSQVTDLQVEKASAKSLHVTWKMPKDIPGILQRYHVTYEHDRFRDCPKESRIAESFVTMNTTKSDILLDNLQTYSAYNICVTAETVEIGPSACILGLSNTAGMPEEGPVALTDREGCELWPTEALLRWTLPDACRSRGPVTTFNVDVYDTTASQLVLSSRTAEPQILLKGLRPGVWYDASVAAVRLVPNHEKELHLAFRTPTEDEGEGVFFVASQRHPYKLKMSNVSHDNIVVSWERADNFSKIEKFSLEVSESMSYLLFPHVKKEMKTFVSHESEKNEYFYTVKDLLPSTVYRVSVRGVGDSEDQPSILQMQTSMKDAHINEDFVVDSVTTTTATLVIPPADQFVTKYSAYFVIVSSPDLRSDEKLQWPDMPSNIRSEVTRAANISSNSLHWLAAELKPVNATSYFVVGGSSVSTQFMYSHGNRNPPLRPGQKHVLTLVLLNAVDWESRVVALSVGVTTPSELQLGWLALLLLLPVAGYAIWILRRKSFFTSNQFSRSSRSDTDSYVNIEEDE